VVVATVARGPWTWARAACSLREVSERVVQGLAIREWGSPGEPGVLLWPGMGWTSGYFAGVASALAGRVVAVDPPGFGLSEPPAAYAFQTLLEQAAAVLKACDCHAVVGHSLGANIAVGLAAAPPPGLRAAVLIDGGFLDAAGLAQLGMPATASRAELVEWMAANELRFPDWASAIGQLAAMIGTTPTPAIEAYLRGLLIERDGEICDPSVPDRLADMLLAVLEANAPALAPNVAVPTLLLACGQPPEHRAERQAAWERFAGDSPMIEVVVAEQWGHNPILQAPTESSELIGGWLRSRL
jgi:pimeloyl-ACP methyl ester carboxylesterase